MEQSLNGVFKILFIGDSCVGKTTFLLRLTDNKFVDTYISTIGVDFKIINNTVDGINYKLQLWDTAGQERFKTITKSYYKNCDGVIIMYDICDIESFNNVKTWVNEIKNSTDNDISLILVGNKSDLDYKRAVSLESVKELSSKLGVPFIETSSKNDINIQNTINKMVRLIKRNEKFHKSVMMESILLHDNRETVIEEGYDCCV